MAFCLAKETNQTESIMIYERFEISDYRIENTEKQNEKRLKMSTTTTTTTKTLT